MNDNNSARSVAIVAVEHFRGILEHTIEILHEEIIVADRLATGLRTEQSVKAIAQAATMSNARERLTDAVVALEVARADARQSLFVSLIDEGVSIGEIARLWGISRQLASRIVHTGTTTPVQVT